MRGKKLHFFLKKRGTKSAFKPLRKNIPQWPEESLNNTKKFLI